ncbi:MAG: hypothetical protein AAGI12_15475 [Pseudomonadota bacterium]
MEDDDDDEAITCDTCGVKIADGEEVLVGGERYLCPDCDDDEVYGSYEDQHRYP